MLVCAACRVLVPSMRLDQSGGTYGCPRLSDGDKQHYAYLPMHGDDDIVVLAQTHCVLPCAIVHLEASHMD